MKICSVEGCNGKYHAKGYCVKHYNQVRRYGYVSRTIYDPNEINIVDGIGYLKLYNRQCDHIATALFSPQDYDVISQYKWYLNADGYVVSGSVAESGSNIRLHRHLLDVIDEKLVVDHINHDRLNNRRENIRTCTYQQNSQNSIPKSSLSKYKGVNYNARDNKWYARIVVGGKNIHLGVFDTDIEAAQQYDIAAKKYFQEYAFLNFDNEEE
jgi:hypothetical protein